MCLIEMIYVLKLYIIIICSINSLFSPYLGL